MKQAAKMGEKDKFLVVVSVMEGRNFPKRPGYQLIAEARFDGELLATDAVDHTEHPEFTQELAWELGKKALHQHRLQRSSIKVQVYAINTQSATREAVGYVVLDLRSATSQQSTKWQVLLHGKYQKNKPDLRVGLYVDEDKGPSGEQASFKARDAPPRTGTGERIPTQTNSSSTETSDLDPKMLKPILNETEGYYQIGPKAKCSEQFAMSVTIAFATNLPQLIPTNIALPSTGFFFYYSLLGNDVTNESFTDLLNPSFPAERASVRVRSSVDALRLFFAKQPGIQIHLCCGDQSLGSAEIPLQNLIKKDSTEIYMKPITIEGAFQLTPPNRLKQQLAPVPEDQRPVVGVSIALRKEDQAAPGTPKVGSDAPGAHMDEQTQTPRSKKSPKVKQHTPTDKESDKEIKEAATPSKDGAATAAWQQSPSPPPTHEGSYTDTFDTNSKTDNIPSLKEDKVQKTVSSPKRVVIAETPEVITSQAGRSSPPLVQPQTVPFLPQPSMQVMRLDEQEHTTGAQAGSSETTEPHHFCCSIDLRKIHNSDMSHPTNIFLRYTYAFFGSVAPILTHPPVEVRRGSEAVVPQSFCAFDFGTTRQQLHETFSRVPLVVEVWNRDTQRSQNVLLGASRIPLLRTLQIEKTRAVYKNGASGWRQTWVETVPIVAAEGPAKRLGELDVVVSLEDWGPLNLAPGGPATESSSTTAPTTVTSSDSSQPAQPVKQLAASPRESREYRVALELEMWKEQQETVFEEQLKAKEKRYMEALSEEWKRRDKEREIIVQKKVVSYTRLEEQLRKTISDLDKRDQQLSANEQEVMRLRSDLQREHEHKMTEIREASRRLKEDCEHQVQLERNKVKDLEETVAKLKSQLSEAEVKYQNLEKSFTTFKEQQNSKPEVRLQSEINLLTLEKVELERKLEAASKSKAHYKQQYAQGLKELSRLRQKAHADAKEGLRRQQQELHHMRLRYLAAEEKEVVNADKKQLEELKNHLQKLKEAEEAKSQQVAELERTPFGLTTSGPDMEIVAEEDHITRLIEERDTLLRTGVYTTTDRIISELDRQIREAINKRNRMEATTEVIMGQKQQKGQTILAR